MLGRRARPGAGVRCQVPGVRCRKSRFQVVSQGSESGREKWGCLWVVCGNASTLPNPLPRMCQARRKACQLSRHAPDKKSVLAGEAKKILQKMNEQRGNVYENKGPLWKTRYLSRNVYENKGS